MNIKIQEKKENLKVAHIRVNVKKTEHYCEVCVMQMTADINGNCEVCGNKIK